METAFGMKEVVVVDVEKDIRPNTEVKKCFV